MCNYLNSIHLEIFKCMKNIGCCFLCSLRFSGINFMEPNFSSKSLLLEMKSVNEYEPLIDTSPCVICLGMLQNVVLMTFIEKIKKEISETDYDCSMISFSLNIPASILIRERTVYAYLIEKLQNIPENKLKVQNMKDVWKWFLHTKFENCMDKSLKISHFSSPLAVIVSFSYKFDQEECIKFLNSYLNFMKNSNIIKKNEEKTITKKNIENILAGIENQIIKKYFEVPPKTCFVKIDKLEVKHDSIFLGGRYRKFSRRLCQTPWFVQGKCKMESSIQELICSPIIMYTKAESTKFLSSGREDVDVRMLGSGRPFAVEVVNPKITKISQDILLFIKEQIDRKSDKLQIIKDLKLLTKLDLRKLKQGEQSKSKSYRALCICKKLDNKDVKLKNLQNLQNLKIVQYTPIRVLHRRTLSPRERIIHELRVRFPSPRELNIYCQRIKYIPDDHTFIILDIKTQAGTYIKEFIHGDFGRTFPNLCYLLCAEIDIIALDVTNISLEWP